MDTELQKEFDEIYASGKAYLTDSNIEPINMIDAGLYKLYTQKHMSIKDIEKLMAKQIKDIEKAFNEELI